MMQERDLKQYKNIAGIKNVHLKTAFLLMKSHQALSKVIMDAYSKNHLLVAYYQKNRKAVRNERPYIP